MTLGHAAYEAYAAHCGGRSVHGEPLPSWDAQAPAVRAHWEAAAGGVLACLGAGEYVRGLENTIGQAAMKARSLLEDPSPAVRVAAREFLACIGTAPDSTGIRDNTA